MLVGWITTGDVRRYYRTGHLAHVGYRYGTGIRDVRAPAPERHGVHGGRMRDDGGGGVVLRHLLAAAAPGADPSPARRGARSAGAGESHPVSAHRAHGRERG